MTSHAQKGRIDAAVMAEMRPVWGTVSCGTCGQTFASKGAKRRHKQAGCVGSAIVPAVSAVAPDADYTPPEDRYVDMRRHITPRIRALANAEWAAMDAEGRLPADWPERRAKIEAEFADIARDRAEDDRMVAEWEAGE